MPASPEIPRIDAVQLRRILDDSAEFALIDVREEGVFGRDGHLLMASNLPLSKLERRARRALPNTSVRIVLCDAGDDRDALAHCAAMRLQAGGYRNLQVLDGGTSAWRARGWALYGGLNTYSKAFAEQLAHARAIPQATVAEVAQWRAQGRGVHMVDCRPAAEFERMTIPGTTNYPGMELPYRSAQIAPAGDVVLVNCAGRTRSLMATQTLLEAGARNPVYALHGGTMGWALAGRQLAFGEPSACPPLQEGSRAAALTAAQEIAKRHQIRRMDLPGLSALRADPNRTVYVFDVRTPAEYAAGHLPGSVGIGGAQLVHAVDAWAPVRNAHVVLADDDGARATFTAMWLQQMGWYEVHCLRVDPLLLAERESTAASPVLNLEAAQARLRTLAEAERLQASGAATLVDIDDSLTYKRMHIAGAWHAVRSRLATSLPTITAGSPRAEIILTCPDGALARIAVAEVERWTDQPASALAGGTAAWVAAGMPTAAGAERMSGPDDDVWLRAQQRAGDNREAMQEYLDWEEGLVQAIAMDADFRFREAIR